MHIIFVCASARLETITLLLSLQRILKYFVYFAKYAKCFSSPHRLPTNHAFGTCQGGTSVRSSKQSTLLETKERSLSMDQKRSPDINSVCLIVLLKECEPVKSQHHSCCQTGEKVVVFVFLPFNPEVFKTCKNTNFDLCVCPYLSILRDVKDRLSS